jgi:hypothetical protein
MYVAHERVDQRGGQRENIDYLSGENVNGRYWNCGGLIE